jgi:hypothetical protein
LALSQEMYLSRRLAIDIKKLSFFCLVSVKCQSFRRGDTRFPKP